MPRLRGLTDLMMMLISLNMLTRYFIWPKSAPVGKLSTTSELFIALLLLTFLTACHGGKLKPYPSSQLNPYRGAIKDILPKQVGDYALVQVSPLKEIEAELKNPTDGVGAIYNSSNNHTVQHLLASFASAAEANQELDAALKRYQEAHMKVQVQAVKDTSGQDVGRRLIVNDGKTEAMNWTNGSLYCTVVAYTGYSSEFVKDLPY
jgi:hypothetical protein